MTKGLVMKSKKLHGSILSLMIVALLLAGGCKNPFQSGLGDKVDIGRPIVSLDAPDPGDFLRGDVIFTGRASDDVSVAAVRISFDRGVTWIDVDTFDPNTTEWSHAVDTRLFPNGRLNVRIRVIDGAGKQTTTEELLFTVDNEGPRIFVLVPAFTEGSALVAVGGLIAGTVTDAEGVYTSVEQDGLFPPQIRFWQDGTEPGDWEDLDIETNEGDTKADFTFPLTGVPTGPYLMRIRAVDVSGQESVLPPIEEAPFAVEIIPGQGPPTLSAFAFGAGTINTVGGNNYARTDFSFTVTASDSDELDTVTVRRNGELVDDTDPDVSLSVVWTGDPTDRADLTFEQSVGGGAGLEDGVYEYRIRAINALTLVSEITRTVVVDTTPPEVEITNLRPTVVDDSDPGNIIERVNGVIRVNVSAGDENGLAGVRWWLLPATDPTPGYDSDGGTAFGASPYVVEIDSTGFDDETEHILHIIARDRAGNDAHGSREFIIDQSSDNPTVTFTDIDPSVIAEEDAGVGGVNLLESNARIRGVIEDDDRVDRSSVEIRLNADGGGEWVSVDTVGPGERTVSFTHDVDHLGEGVHGFELRFSDDPAAKLGASPPVATTTVGPIYFVIDLAPPIVAVTSPGPGTFQGTPFALIGTASDPNGLHTHDFGGALGERGYVEIETPADPGVWVRFPVDGGTNGWTVELGSAEVGDGLFDGSFEGPRTVQIRARDRFGKQSTITYSFTVDTIPPEVAISAPTEADWLSGASGSVQGTATDADSTVTAVRVWVGPQGTEPPAEVTEWTLATGTSSWNSSWNLNALGEGLQRAHVRARDAAGNWSSTLTRDFGVDQSPPVLTETTIGGPTGARNEAFSLGGSVSDTNALASLVVTQRRGTDDPVEVYRNESLSGTSQPWTLASLPRDPDAADPADPAAVDVSDGVYVYEITVTDVAGKTATLTREVRVDLVGPEVTILTPSDGAAVQGTALLITGTAADVGGVSAVTETRYWVGAVAATPPADYDDWSLATGAGNWNATLNFAPGEEGARRLHVVARDAAGNWSEDVATVAFNLDQAPPTLSGFTFAAGTINPVGGNNYARDDFGFTFTAADSNELADVRITRNGTEIFSHVYAGGETSAVVNVDQEVGGSGLANGIYDYLITVTDVVGKTAQLSRTVIVDTTPPVVELNSLNPLVTNGATDYLNGTIRFTVSATDDNGLIDVRWWILPAADGPPQFADAGAESFGPAPYAALLDTTTLTDLEPYRLHVIAADRAGNETRIERAFTVDQSTDLPVVTITSPSADAFVDGGHIVRGSVTDDDAVNTASIEVRYHNGSEWSSWAPATSVTGSGREVTFTYTLPPEIGADGAKRVQVRAGDLASAKFGGDAAVTGESPEVEFTLDTVAPVVEIVTPVANATRRETFTVSGSVVEANLESLRVSLNGASPVDATVTGSDETKSWEYGIPEAVFDALDQGPATITVTAIDRVGRSNTAQRVVFKDTAGPAIAFSSIVPGDNTIITESTPTVQGSFADEFSNVAATFEYRLNAADSSDPWTSASVTGSGKSVSWSVPVSALPDGSHRIDLRVADEIGNETVIEDVAFRIDRVAPVVIISEPPSGSIYAGVESGPVFTLSGTATDANLLSVSAAINAGGSTDITGTIVGGESTWSFPVGQGDFEILADGPNTVTITAVDEAGRVTVREWAFTKDTEAPAISLSNLESDGSTVLLEGSPRVQGTTTDDFGVSRVETRIERLPLGSAIWESYNAVTTAWVPDAPTEDDDDFWTDRTITVNQTVVTWTKQLGSDGLDLPDGLYRVRVRAHDRATPDPNRETLEAVEFRIDRVNPALSLNATAGFQRQDFALSGTASDLNGIVSVQAKVGDSDFTTGTIADATTSNGYATWTLTVPTTGLAQGSHTVHVQATDGAERTTTLTRDFTFDGVPPSVSINEPLSETRVNGLVVVRGTADDDNAVAAVRYRFGDGAEVWQTAGLGGGLYSWSYTFDNINTFANTAAVTEVDPVTGDPAIGTNVWALPFQVQVTDVAGNVTEELSYRLFVDPDMDAPQVTVISPTNDQIVGGSVRVSGFASDDDWVRRVEMRVDPTGTGGSFGPWEDVTLVNQGTQVNWFRNINTDGTLNPPAGEIRDVRIQVRAWDSKDFGITDGIVGDTTEINIKFDSGVPVIEDIEIVRDGVAEPYVAGVRAAGVFTVRATIRDEGGIASIRKRGEEDVAFVDILGDGAITTTPVERTAGTFEVDRKYLITSLGSTDFTAIGATSNTVGISFRATGPGAGTGTAFEATGPIADPAAQFFVYQVELEIDSTTVNGGVYAGTSGFYSLAIQATDNATPTPYLTQENLNIQIDNFFPLAEYTSSPNAAGTDYFIQGRAWDVAAGSGSIQGIDRVVVYFQRDGSYINLNGDTFNSTPRLMRNAQTPGNEASAPMETLPFPATDGVDGIVINNNEVTTDLDGNGYIEGWTDDGIFKNWYVRFDTTQLDDGPVTLNYVVVDRAGNATRYVQPLYIRNNAPRIDAVLLGTDVDADGFIGDEASGESRLITTNFSTTNFTVRNDLLQFTVEASSGNAPRRYSVGYVTATSGVAATALTMGSVYTISTPGDTNWTQVGAPNNSVGTTFVATAVGAGSGQATGYTIAEQNGGDFTGNVVTITDFSGIPDTTVANGGRFVIKVYDSTVDGGTEAEQLADAVVIGLNIDNEDNVPPVIRVAPFGQRFSISASAASQDPVDVTDYIENLVTTGSGFSQQRHGYVQYAEHSTWPGSTPDASDVSGKVIFLGRTTDNQRIARITAQIAGFDGGTGVGSEFDIATWDGGGVSAPAGRAIDDVAASTSDWGFEVVSGSQFITEADGHVLNWRFAWNSAAIENVAQLGVPVVFRAYDFGPGAGNDSDDDITVDVVPYVTRIQTTQSSSGGLKNTNIRASNGEYSIRSGANGGASSDFITVRGFNLNPIPDGVRLAPEGSPSGWDGSSLTGVPIAFNAPTNGFTQLTLSNVSTVSGFLGIVSGTVGSPVAAINNVNDNDVTYNQEPDEFVRRNRLFTDDRFLRFFEVSDTGIVNANYPNMVMDGDTPYFGYIQSGAEFDLQVRRGFSGASNTPIVRTLAGDQMSMVRDSGGRYHMISVTNFNGGRMHYFNHEYATLYQGPNSHDVGGNNGASQPYWAAFTTNRNYTSQANNNAIDLDSVNYTPGLQLGRYQRPVIRSVGDSTTSAGAGLYLAVFDSFSGELIFRNWRVGDSLTGGTVDLFGSFRSTLGDRTGTAGDVTRHVITDGGNGSEYFDMVVRDDGVVVVAYYNPSISRLTIRYTSTTENGSTPQPITGAAPAADVFWSAPFVLANEFVGWFPSMTIHTDGSLHIAAYDSGSANLSYIVLPSITATSAEVVTVDTYGSVGYYNDLKIVDDVPWIAYYSISETGTRDSVKLARFNGDLSAITPGVDAQGFVTGDWSTMTIPVLSVPRGNQSQFLKVNLGFTTAGVPVVSHTGASIEYTMPLAAIE